MSRRRAPGSTRRRFLRDALGLAGSSLLAGCGLPPLPWQAPPTAPRVGVISGFPAAAAAPQFEGVRQGLREHGYEEGRTILAEWRTLDNRPERAPEVIDELLRLGVAAILTGNPVAVLAAKRATGTVPIVMAGVFIDPVGQGAVASLNRPGGNVTGLSLSHPTLGAKRLQLLKEAVPGARRLGLLWDRTLGSAIEGRVRPIEETANSLGMEARSFFVGRAEELEPAFGAMVAAGVEALWATDGPLTTSHAGLIADLALRHRLPGIYGQPEFVRAGGLMEYGVDQVDLYRRAVGYLDRILKGADPAELPVEQPTKLDFVINLKTAGALGLTLPDSVLLQATEVIQ